MILPSWFASLSPNSIFTIQALYVIIQTGMSHNFLVSKCLFCCPWWCCHLNWHLIVYWFMISTASMPVLLGDVTSARNFINFQGVVGYPANLWYDYIPTIQVHIDIASCRVVKNHCLWKIFVHVFVFSKCTQIMPLYIFGISILFQIIFPSQIIFLHF